MIKGEIFSIYNKLILLIIVTSTAFLLLYASLFYYLKKQKEDVYTTTTKQFTNEISSLIEFNTDPLKSSIKDYAYWDDMVTCIKKEDKNWYELNIAGSLEIYDVEQVMLLNLDGKIIGQTRTDKIKSPLNFTNKQLYASLLKERIIYFHQVIPEGIAEVYMATVNINGDPIKLKSKAEGYFAMIRLIDKEYVDKLKKVSSSEINFNTNITQIPNKQTLQMDVPLYSWDKKNIGYLTFSRGLDVNFSTTQKILFVILIFSTVIFFIFVFLLREWISVPLLLTTKILESEHKESLEKLKTTTGEFGKIGSLFEESILQKEQLRTAKQRAEESDQLKAFFLTNLSHEIRTPMNAILGFTELLKSKGLKKKHKKEYLNIISKSGSNLVSIIDDLIEMSKIDAQQVVPKKSNFNIEHCILEIFESVKITIPTEKNLVFRMERLGKPIPFEIISDITKIKQILTNLLTNAVKYTKEGEVFLSYQWNEVEKTIDIHIQDTGLGIDETSQKYIFERFRRVEGDYAIKVGGLGLGLAISKAYSELLGGNITLESKIDVGSTFKLTLPADFYVANIDTRPKVVPNDINTIISNIRINTILIAEDDNLNFLLFKKIMEKTPIKIIRAKDGEEAVNLYDMIPNIDLVLMDIKMPKKNGYEAMKEIKLINPLAVIIAQTAFSSPDELDKIAKNGFDGHITKPIVKESLFDILFEHCSKTYLSSNNNN